MNKAQTHPHLLEDGLHPREQSITLAPFFNLALDMLCVAGTDGYFKKVNPAFHRNLGFTSRELLARPFVDFVHPDDRSNTLQEVNKLSQGEDTVFFTNRYQHKDGGYVWIEWNAAPDRNRQLIYAAARNITERRRGEERFRMVVNAAPNGVIMMTNDGSIVLTNPKATALTGLPQEHLEDRCFPDFLPISDRDSLMKIAARCFESGECGPDAGNETSICHCDGRLTPVSIRFSRAESDDARFLLVVIQDLSEKQKSQDELKESALQLRRSNEQLDAMRLQLIQAEKMESIGRLAAGVAHEVKNPLAMLQLGLELLIKKIPTADPGATEVAGMMQEAIERANTIVGEMLDISRSRQLEMATHDMNAVIREALQLCRHEFVTEKIEVVEQLGTSAMAVTIDRQKIVQVLLNLLINSVHAMDSGGVLTVRILQGAVGEIDRNEGTRTADHLRSHDQGVTVILEDTGTGIPSAMIHRIFEPFFTTKPTGKGTGLGLAIARSIIELHRGTIRLENRRSAGARATITLPCATDQPHRKNDQP